MKKSAPEEQDKKIPTFTGKQVVDALSRIYPKVETELAYSSVFQLLIATVLSAQTTDVQVNAVTPKLFARYPDAHSLSKARIAQLESLVKSTGFYHVKARRIRDISSKLLSDFGGKVPSGMEGLLSLPGIGRKTANIILSVGYNIVEGIAVDTHVFRVSRRIGLTRSNTPEKIELDLMKITPKSLWPQLSILLILHGRRICFARSPQCAVCPLSAKCLYFQQLKEQGSIISSERTTIL